MPRIETQTRTVYAFDELSDDSKDRARSWWREFIASDTANWSADSVIDDAATIADILGIDLRQRSVKLYGGGSRWEPLVYWSLDRGGGVGFDASYKYAPGSARRIRQHAPQDADLHRIADALQRAQRPHFYQLTAAVRTAGRDGTLLEVNVYDDRYDYEYLDEADPAAEDVADAIRDFAHWVHSSLQREFDYRMSDEAVDEDIRCNEYEFTEEGERV